MCRKNTYYLKPSTAKLEEVRKVSVSSDRTFHGPSECDTPEMSQGGQHNIRGLPGRDTACDLLGQTWGRFESHYPSLLVESSLGSGTKKVQT